jgi:hypothetical protein
LAPREEKTILGDETKHFRVRTAANRAAAEAFVDSFPYRDSPLARALLSGYKRVIRVAPATARRGSPVATSAASSGTLAHLAPAVALALLSGNLLLSRP